ncbi:MAG: nucleotidyltransferase domain-containing protein, partial [Ignavibacteriaceae bacterium]|nr:nucleotidyltransferase domain-containing protein [Ignavibacteriaceae bacterium]MCU0365038.1 nucleotidyltransferase domain-containing protein [Ignavibacteriaceae bacterium]MCU0406728.1 nucleotidyltransferase domain-containing protein [Ignavibacteriaceae bacterium]
MNNFTLNPLKKSIIRTLAYYDIFSYPLTADEIYYNLDENHTTPEEVKKELESLYSNQLIQFKNNFYLLNNDDSYIRRREAGNELAVKRLKTARRVSGFISRFPFIRGILLSGSISKGFMEEDSDIDYFVITHPNRVWFSRLMLMLFKKIFLFNSKKIFCINYFVDSENLEIEEKNIFTATELVTLLPTFGREIYDELYKKNVWVKQFFPNYPKRDTREVLNRKDGVIKSLLERILGRKLGDKIDDYAMVLFDKFNKTKYKDYDKEEFKIAFKSSKKESKHHPKFFQ